jgi:hypothetical protein
MFQYKIKQNELYDFTPISVRKNLRTLYDCNIITIFACSALYMIRANNF